MSISDTTIFLLNTRSPAVDPTVLREATPAELVHHYYSRMRAGTLSDRPQLLLEKEARRRNLSLEEWQRLLTEFDGKTANSERPAA